MNHLDLFSGIGGFALAARWAGFTTIGFCEIDPFCRKVLAKNFPGVPIHDDIRTLTADALAHAGGGEGEQRREPTVLGRRSANAEQVGVGRSGIVDLITGGFPCQPFSVAGERRGAADDRHLWPEMARVVAEVRPRWVVGENVAGFVNMALDDCLADLEALGYEARAVVVPACAVGAPHRRDRVWIVAALGEPDALGRDGRADDEGQAPSGRNGIAPSGFGGRGVDPHAPDGGVRRGQPSGQAGLAALGGEAVPDTTRERLDRRGDAGQAGRDEPTNGGPHAADAGVQRLQERDGLRPRRQDANAPTPAPGRRDAESRVGRGLDGVSPWLDGGWERGIPRVSTGIPNRVGRLKALGNAIVPQVAFVILSEIARMEAA